MKKISSLWVLIGLVTLTGQVGAKGIAPKGMVVAIPKCYIVSIGITKYNLASSTNDYTNSARDAIRFANHVSDSFKQLYKKDAMSRISRRAYTIQEQAFEKQRRSKGETFVYRPDSLLLGRMADTILNSHLVNYVLLNEQATGQTIRDSLRAIQKKASPYDYFFFNFSGNTTIVNDVNGHPVTYFNPFTTIAMTDTMAVKAVSIPLHELSSLFEYITAQEQLIVVEAGDTRNLYREWVKGLFERNPAIAQLTQLNRILITPTTYGFDIGCGQQQGPINYFLTSLPPGQIFRLFRDGEKTSAVIKQKEVDCKLAGYLRITFERELLADLAYYLGGNKMKTRGVTTDASEQQSFRRGIRQKHALLIGTDHYAAFTGLDNPVYDVREMADVLNKGFGFQVDTLIDAPRHEILSRLTHYANTLDSTDQLLIFVAGHGDFDKQFFDDGFFLLSDSKDPRQDPYRETQLSFGQFSRIVNHLRPRQIMVVLDVCFGGGFDRRIALNKDRDSTPLYTDLDSTSFLADNLLLNTRKCITSGGLKKVPDGYAQKHSPFSYKLLELLRGRGGKNGILTIHDLYAYVQKLPSGPKLGSFESDEAGSNFVLLAEPAKADKTEPSTPASGSLISPINKSTVAPATKKLSQRKEE